MKSKQERRIKRHKKIRKTIQGNKKIPRLSIFRSSRYIYAQVIDDSKSEVIFAVTEKEINKKGTKTEKAYEVGKILAEKALKKKIKAIVFDRGGYQYHGRVEALAKGAREGGLQF